MISNIRRPGVYTQVDTNTERNELPTNSHNVLFIASGDRAVLTPADVYDKHAANRVFGYGSEMARMITAAIKTNRVISVQGMALSGGGGGESGDGGGGEEDDDYTPDPNGTGGNWEDEL